MLSIKDWAEADRPREKLLHQGAAALTDAELLAILIATGTRNHTALELARQVLQLTQQQLNPLGKLAPQELQAVHGIGEAKAITIVAALELGRRRKQEEATEPAVFRSSAAAAQLFTAKLSDLPHEEMWVLLLNRSLKMLSIQKVAQGGVGQLHVDIRAVLRPAIDQAAHTIVLAHNHPSGTALPSEEDLRLTQKIKQAAQLFDIQLSDHIIVSARGYYSFADKHTL